MKDKYGGKLFAHYKRDHGSHKKSRESEKGKRGGKKGGEKKKLEKRDEQMSK